MWCCHVGLWLLKVRRRSLSTCTFLLFCLLPLDNALRPTLLTLVSGWWNVDFLAWQFISLETHKFCSKCFQIKTNIIFFSGLSASKWIHRYNLTGRQCSVIVVLVLCSLIFESFKLKNVCLISLVEVNFRRSSKYWLMPYIKFYKRVYFFRILTQAPIILPNGSQ